MTTGDRIRTARKARKLTQAQLGQLLQPPQTRQAIHDLEKGRYEPSANTIRGLCAALGVSCDWLLGITA